MARVGEEEEEEEEGRTSKSWKTKVKKGRLEGRLTAAAVGAKMREVLSAPGARQEAEKRCKWFLLWNER